MGILLLLIALIFEIAFAIYCMVTKQNHKKIKNWMRIAAVYCICNAHTFIGDCVELPLGNACAYYYSY